MRSPVPKPTELVAGGILLALLCPAAVVAHDEGGDMAMGMAAVPTSSDATAPEPTAYSQHSEHSSLMVAHILLMTLAWVFILPIG